METKKEARKFPLSLENLKLPEMTTPVKIVLGAVGIVALIVVLFNAWPLVLAALGIGGAAKATGIV